MSTTAAPATGERKVVADLPPWCASVRFAGGALVVTARVPVPEVAMLEQLAYQRDQYEHAVAVSAMLINSAPPPPATFDLQLAMTGPQAEAMRDALDELLRRAREAASVVDVVDVD